MSKVYLQEYNSKKYLNSTIPSREFIIKFLKKRETPVNLEELVIQMKIKSEEQIEAFHLRLQDMERDGQLIFTNFQCYAIPKPYNFLKGTVVGHRDSYGFLRVKGHKNDFYLSSKQMKTCIHGDQVLAQSIDFSRKNRREARIIRVLVPKTQIIGRYFIDSGIYFVIPYDTRFSFKIFISLKETMNACSGALVVVELIQRPVNFAKAIGKIIEILGKNMNADMFVELSLRTREIPHIWPKEVREQIKDFKEEVSENSKIDRIDLRNLPLITIDEENALDFDDAIFCRKKLEGGWNLWVAIADVSYYVRPYTPIDNEARNRGTSIYFPSKVIPMLPEVLSNNLCSLKPKVDRLCIVCEMDISAQGDLIGFKFYEAIIRSHARLSYTEVWCILQGNQRLRKQYESLVLHIKELFNLYEKLDLARKQRGGISIKIEEVRFILNSEKRVKKIKQAKRNDAHNLIEECMILANISAACFVEQAKAPALFRVHDKPSIDSIIAFRSILSKLRIELSGGDEPESRDYADLLKLISNRSEYDMIQSILLRSMKQAIYNPENRGHFGLALQSYTHFTSSIRRYPDLSLHRIIKHLIKINNNKKINGKSKITGGWKYSAEDMFKLGQHCSMTERRADEASREVEEWLKCDFISDYLGKIFKGIISGVTKFGFFVRINDFLIDGLVHVSSLCNDYYYFDKTEQRLIGKLSNRVYRLGDRVKVRLEAVNIDDRKIDFSLISIETIYVNNKTSIYTKLNKLD